MQAGRAPCCPQLVSIISQEEVAWRGAPGSELWPDRQGERWGEGSEAGSPLEIRNHRHGNYRSGRLQWWLSPGLSVLQSPAHRRPLSQGADTAHLDL